MVTVKAYGGCAIKAQLVQALKDAGPLPAEGVADLVWSTLGVRYFAYIIDGVDDAQTPADREKLLHQLGWSARRAMAGALVNHLKIEVCELQAETLGRVSVSTHGIALVTPPESEEQ